MAHHNSTPQSVLDAPQATTIVLHATAGENRKARRARGALVPLRTQNEPYRKPAARGKAAS